jgi:hypothetical protein
VTQLAQWLAAQMRAWGYSQIQGSVHTGVVQGTLSAVPKKGHASA